MLEVTEAAIEKIEDYFKSQKEKSPIRVFLNEGG